MADLTRRGFIVTSAGAAAGVATVGAIAAAPKIAKILDGGAAASAARRGAVSASDPVVAYIRNATSGEIGLLVGHREVTINDPDLVGRLLDAAQ